MLSSSGLLLYASLVDLLAEDFLSDEANRTLTKKDRMLAFGCVILGGEKFLFCDILQQKTDLVSQPSACLLSVPLPRNVPEPMPCDAYDTQSAIPPSNRPPTGAHPFPSRDLAP